MSRSNVAIQPPKGSARLLSAGLKAWRLIRTHRSGLLVSIPIYRCWARFCGADFGIVSTHDLALDPNRANYHKDGGGPLLRELLNQLQIKDTDAVLDLGSGKGGAMATLARYPFHAVHGVELSSELVDTARKNFEKLGLLKCAVFQGDAATFTELDNYTYIFMYNPFPEVVLKEVLANFEDSLRRKPRKIQLVYSNPLHEQAVLAMGSFEKTLEYEPYDGYLICVYTNRTSPN